MHYHTPKDAEPFFASKWLHVPFLIDAEEMKGLCARFRDAHFFSTMGVAPKDGNRVAVERFLEEYQRYVDLLKAGVAIKDEDFRFYFTLAISASHDALQTITLPNDQEIIKPRAPVVQSQLHRFDYSVVDRTIRPRVFGKGTISWGLSFSYPQLFQEAKTRICQNAYDPEHFANAALFRTFQHWIRHNTLPVRFRDGEGEGEIVSPLRLGKGCFEWVQRLVELENRGLQVVSYGY